MLGELSEDEKIEESVNKKFPLNIMFVEDGYYDKRDLYRESIKEGINIIKKESEW
jgi:UDP-N-acetyl-D-mannosaminuronic acid transferase (WecB/TagA/CpsF family)